MHLELDSFVTEDTRKIVSVAKFKKGGLWLVNICSRLYYPMGCLHCSKLFKACIVLILSLFIKDTEYIFICFTFQKDTSTDFAIKTFVFRPFLRYTDLSPIKNWYYILSYSCWNHLMNPFLSLQINHVMWFHVIP